MPYFAGLRLPIKFCLREGLLENFPFEKPAGASAGDEISGSLMSFVPQVLRWPHQELCFRKQP
jgi:hypothetical protein